MKNKILILVLLWISLFGLTACNSENKKNQTDAIKFKEEYESLNGTIREKDGKKIRSIEIDDDNPFIYKSASDIIKMMEEKESFVVYLGFSDCPWCRSIVPNLVQVAKDLELDKIYYVDIKEIRDTLKLDKEGNVITDKEGTDEYYELLDKLDNILNNYTLTDQDGNEVNTGEKRVYAPSIISIIDGTAVEITDGISEKQTDGYMELTNEMQEESYNKIKCSMECVVDNKKTCSTKSSC